MNETFYNMIFKRKSFHIFRNVEGEITEEELKTIEEKYKDFSPLYENIKTEIRIVPSEKTTCKRGQDYCILLYSEQKDGFLPNIGYLGEQLDLLLASMNIGALWFGIGKTEEKNENGLDYVIMFATKKVNDEKKFRKGQYMGKGWRDDFDAMARKTVYRKLIGKWGVMSIQYQTAKEGATLAQQMQEEYIDNGSTAPIVDADFAPVVDDSTGEVLSDG